MKNMRNCLGLIAMAMMCTNDYTQPSKPKRIIKKWDDLTYDEQQYYIKQWNIKQEQLALNKGLKKFEYNGVFVFALNQKNADRKAKKLNIL